MVQVNKVVQSERIKKVAERVGVSEYVAKRIISEYLDSLTLSICRCEPVEIRGIVTISASIIDGKIVPRSRVSESLKKRIAIYESKQKARQVDNNVIQNT